jgi:hypothetical protein
MKWPTTTVAFGCASIIWYLLVSANKPDDELLGHLTLTDHYGIVIFRCCLVEFIFFVTFL